MSFLEAILRSFGRAPLPPPNPQVNESLLPMLAALAQQEGRPLDDLLNDLLSRALNERLTAVTNLRQWEALSLREQEVAAMTCLGFTNHQIAARLVVSPNTIKTHIRNIFYKCNVNSKAELRELLSGWDFQEWLTGQDMPLNG
jgi:DNA-binding NarL/FixJ family response regulator